MFAVLKYASGVQQLVEITPISATDPGFGKPEWGGEHPGHGLPDWERPVDPGYGHGFVPVDPGYGQGHPRPDRPGNALPIPPVKPDAPVVLPPGIWPPQLPPNALPPGIDNTLPPGASNKPIVIPPDPDVGIEQPIVIPPLPVGVALLIALPAQGTPKAGTPPNTKPAILVQSGKKPVLVYVSAAASPK